MKIRSINTASYCNHSMINQKSTNRIKFKGLTPKEREITLIQQKIPFKKLEDVAKIYYFQYTANNKVLGVTRGRFHSNFERAIKQYRQEEPTAAEILFGYDYSRVIKFSKKLIEKVLIQLPKDLKIKTEERNKFELSESTRDKVSSMINKSWMWSELMEKFICEFYSTPEEKIQIAKEKAIVSDIIKKTRLPYPGETIEKVEASRADMSSLRSCFVKISE